MRAWTIAIGMILVFGMTLCACSEKISVSFSSDGDLTADGNFSSDGDVAEDGDSSTDGDSPTPIAQCTPNVYRCYHDDVQLCNDRFEWTFYRDCSAEGKNCIDGQCVDTDGETIPDGDLVADGDLSTDGDLPIDGDLSEAEADSGETSCTSDADCVAQNTYCFFENSEENHGVCRLYCNQGGDCPQGWNCSAGTCERIENFCTSDTECGIDEFCSEILPGYGLCTSYCFAMNSECSEGSICDEDAQSDTYGHCIEAPGDGQVCRKDSDCEDSEHCNLTMFPGMCAPTEGTCIEDCGPNNPCPADKTCNSYGRCVSGEPDCGYDCPQGYVCDPVFNTCVLNCPECGPNECCDADSAPNCYMCNCTNPAVCGFGLPSCCFGSCCSAVIYGVAGYCL